MGPVGAAVHCGVGSGGGRGGWGGGALSWGLEELLPAARWQSSALLLFIKPRSSIALSVR